MAGRLVFAMHAHLPYVLGHGEWPFGSSWLYEAAADTYLPLLGALEELAAAGIRPALTLEISPVLGEQLDDPRFREAFPTHLAQLVDAAEHNETTAHRRGEPDLATVARRWADRYRAATDDFARRDADLLGGFAALDAAGSIELFTCARTHGFLPLLGSEARVQAQVDGGVAWFARRFARRPRGIWLPECAYRPPGPWTPAGSTEATSYRPGLESVLRAAGLDWTMVDAHLVTEGGPIGSYPPWSAAAGEGLSPHQIYAIGGSGVAAFIRDPTTTLQVWSGDIGYPGNPWYLEFHRRHHEGGLRYWRVTDRELQLHEKEGYHPTRAAAAVAEQAHHFAGLVAETIADSEAAGVADPVVFAPYDAELFGHWWREGVDWFAAARRELAAAGVDVVTASEALDAVGPAGSVVLPEGSWGAGGDFRVWDDPATEPLWSEVYAAEAALAEVEQWAADRPGLAAILSQLRRTVLLIESSDWPFLTSTGTAAEYASARVAGHGADARRLRAMARRLVDGESATADELSTLAFLHQRDRVWIP
jgi:1,4-alpha-glucan branching enzyme